MAFPVPRVSVAFVPSSSAYPRVSPNEPSAENAPPANSATTAHAVYVSASTVTADVAR